jgi:hypothetical protein
MDLETLWLPYSGISANNEGMLTQLPHRSKIQDPTPFLAAAPLSSERDSDYSNKHNFGSSRLDGTGGTAYIARISMTYAFCFLALHCVTGASGRKWPFGSPVTCGAIISGAKQATLDRIPRRSKPKDGE